MAGEEIRVELETYQRMRDELLRHHRGKFVVIHDGKLLDAFDSLQTAASEAVKHFGKGPYLIRKVGSEEHSVPLPISLQFPHADH